MTITFTPQQPANRFGPGLAWRLESSLPGPFPTTAVWTLQVNTPSDLLNVAFFQLHQTSPIVFITPGITKDWGIPDWSQHVVTEEASVQLNATVQLSGAGPADDTGAHPTTWSNTAGLPALLQHTVASSGEGLTAEQSQQLLETWQGTAPVIAVDTTVPVTSPPSIPGGVVSGTLPVPIFGLIVNIDQVPPQLVPNTPDGDYWVPSLAVVRIYRGSDVWMRVPIHTSSKMVPLFTDVVTAAVATLTAATWLARMTYQVAFREGVVGRVTEMRFP